MMVVVLAILLKVLQFLFLSQTEDGPNAQNVSCCIDAQQEDCAGCAQH
jgi:hypothetical protein